MRTQWLRLTALAALLPLAAACDDSTGPASDGSRVSFSVAVTQPAPTAARTAGDAVFAIIPVTDGIRTLNIESVELVLREIELERQDSDACAATLPGSDDDDCEEFETGPVLLELPVDAAGAVQAFEITGVPAGLYDEVEFDVHKPEDDPGDDAFLLAHPEFDGISIRVGGTFDDGQGGGAQPFLFLSDISQEQEFDLVPPLQVGASQVTNVTLQVDVTTWFIDEAGTVIDPATATIGGPNESVVEENIQNSLKVHEDDDRDGDDDGDDS
ncbi:MAG: hypothetical protein RRA92_10270 [Gemmatimonadota bacterium]|nr:hypothetical protein [Gemmatimonadota bacterium]